MFFFDYNFFYIDEKHKIDWTFDRIDWYHTHKKNQNRNSGVKRICTKWGNADLTFTKSNSYKWYSTDWKREKKRILLSRTITLPMPSLRQQPSVLRKTNTWSKDYTAKQFSISLRFTLPSLCSTRSLNNKASKIHIKICHWMISQNNVASTKQVPKNHSDYKIRTKGGKPGAFQPYTYIFRFYSFMRGQRCPKISTQAWIKFKWNSTMKDKKKKNFWGKNPTQNITFWGWKYS